MVGKGAGEVDSHLPLLLEVCRAIARSCAADSQSCSRYVARLSYYSNSAKLASVLSKMAGQRMLLLLLASGNLAQGAKDLSTKGV